MDSLLRGSLTQLVAFNPEKHGPLHARWAQNSEFARLLDFGPIRTYGAAETRAMWEQEVEQANYLPLAIQTVVEPQVIGFIDLSLLRPARDAWLGIGIGEPAYWGKGYGSDALRTALRVGFMELDLHRVTLAVFSYNTRALRAYEKCGFVIEGRSRQTLCRDGQRWDVVLMGVLRREWENDEKNKTREEQ